jgi:pimeloyl-ACP methyl ester carboxylesterase
MRETVVLVHGLWMTGLEMGLLSRRLRGCGFSPRRFPFGEVRRSARENAGSLHAWLAEVPGETVHFVAHSLGGILLLHLFKRFADLRPGRVVFLGTSCRGSIVAQRLSHLPLLRAALGRSMDQGLDGGAPGWSGERELGVVAGTLGLGLGWLSGGLDPPHDGTVAVAETRLAGARAHITLPVSHFGLLLSADVARQVCGFLRSGRFQF